MPEAITTEAGPRYPLASVDNALKLILMVRDRRVVRISEVSRELGVAGSTAHRLLAMLQHWGFVRQDPTTKAYLPGPELMCSPREPWMGLERRARPFLERVVARVRETAHLCVLEGTETVFVSSVEGTRHLRTGSRAGLSLPAHCTSGGTAMLAQLPPAAVRELYGGRVALEAMTDRSIASFDALERELRTVARQGYAVNMGESEPEVAAVAVALPPLPGGPSTAFAVSAPIARLVPERASDTVGVLREATEALAGELAASG